MGIDGSILYVDAEIAVPIEGCKAEGGWGILGPFVFLFRRIRGIIDQIRRQNERAPDEADK
jgi:hypothetical protein